MAAVPSTSKPDAADRMKTHVRSLGEQYRDVQRDDSDEGRRERATLTAQLRRLTHDQIHPDEEQVEVDVPLAIMGERFMINDVAYGPGPVIVPACIASTLLWMIDQNRKVDIERMRESGRTMNLGVLSERARAISRED